MIHGGDGSPSRMTTTSRRATRVRLRTEAMAFGVMPLIHGGERSPPQMVATSRRAMPFGLRTEAMALRGDAVDPWRGTLPSADGCHFSNSHARGTSGRMPWHPRAMPWIPRRGALPSMVQDDCSDSDARGPTGEGDHTTRECLGKPGAGAGSACDARLTFRCSRRIVTRHSARPSHRRHLRCDGSCVKTHRPRSGSRRWSPR